MRFTNWLERIIDKTNNGLLSLIKGGVGYDNNVDGWGVLKKGQRWTVVLAYSSNLAAGGSYTSSSFNAQDGSGNNYTELRVTCHNEGASSVTVQVQQSADNSTWYSLPNQSITVNDGDTGTMEVDVFMPYIRVVETNNDTANAQTANYLYVVVV